MFSGKAPIGLTLIPALVAATAIVLFLTLPRLARKVAPSGEGGRLRRLLRPDIHATPAGAAEAFTLLRSGDLLVYVGALGYWAFDNAVLWVMFHALGHTLPVAVVAQGYLIGQLGGAIPTPGAGRPRRCPDRIVRLVRRSDGDRHGGRGRTARSSCGSRRSWAKRRGCACVARLRSAEPWPLRRSRDRSLAPGCSPER